MGPFIHIPAWRVCVYVCDRHTSIGSFFLWPYSNLLICICNADNCCLCVCPHATSHVYHHILMLWLTVSHILHDMCLLAVLSDWDFMLGWHRLQLLIENTANHHIKGVSLVRIPIFFFFYMQHIGTCTHKHTYTLWHWSWQLFDLDMECEERFDSVFVQEHSKGGGTVYFQR